MVNYHPELENIPLNFLRKEIEQGRVLPGRKILTEEIKTRFYILEKRGIKTLADLADALKSTTKAVKFAEMCGLSEEYVKMLRREILSYLPKPVSLKDIPGADAEVVKRFAELGIKNSKQCFEKFALKSERIIIAEKTGVPEMKILEMTRLSDLARINGAGPVFIRMFRDVGITSIEDILRKNPEELHSRLRKLNEEKKYIRSMININDLLFCMNFCRFLPIGLEND